MADRDVYLSELARLAEQINERVDGETRELVEHLILLLAENHGRDRTTLPPPAETRSARAGHR